MSFESYIKIFDSYLDNMIFNQFVMLCPIRLSQTDKLNILDYLAYRLQIEFQKKVILLTNKEIDGDIYVINKDTKVSEIPLLINNMNTETQTKYGNVICLIDIDFQYFDDSVSWEQRLVEVMKYYKVPVFGFSNNTQMIKIYEN